MDNYTLIKKYKFSWIILKNNKTIQNAISLMFIQATNFLVPIITLPYLLRIIGIEKFGIMSYALTIMTYLTIFVDYGFNLSATKLIAIYREDKKKKSELFSEILFTKMFLFFISILVIILLCLFIEKVKTSYSLYLIGSLYILGNAITPTWFYQGVEQMKYITYSNAFSKIIQLLIIYIYIKQPEDYKYTIGIMGTTNIISALYNNWVAIEKFELKLYFVKFTSVIKQIKDGLSYFLPNLTISLVNSTTILLLGFYVNSLDIGDYSLAEKIVFGMWTIMAVFSQAIYPKVCRLAQDDFNKLNQFLKLSCLPFILLMIIICISIFLSADYIIFIVAGHYQEKASIVLKMLSIVPIIVSLNIPAYQILLAYNLKKYYSIIFNSAYFMNLVIGILLIKSYGIIGAAANMILIQILITASLHISVAINLKYIINYNKQ